MWIWEITFFQIIIRHPLFTCYFFHRFRMRFKFLIWTCAAAFGGSLNRPINADIFIQTAKSNGIPVVRVEKKVNGEINSL